MKINWKVLVAFMLLFTSCDEDFDKAIFNSEAEIVMADLTSTSFVLTEEDAEEVFQEFEWNDPDFGFSASTTYTVELDLADNDFADAVAIATTQTNSATISVGQINSRLLSLGIEPEENASLAVRVKAVLLNTIDPIYSDLKGFDATPYSVEPTPLFPVPDNLFIVGSATPGGWANPVTVPSQQFTKVNSYTFEMVLSLTGGQEYLVLPVNGSWDNKYNPPTSGGSGVSGNFQPNAGGNNIPGPVADGLYRIKIDFVEGTYSTTLIATSPIPANLFIVGDATPGGWGNPVPTPAQQFTQISNGEFQLNISLTSGASYLFLPVNGSWDSKYGGTEKLGGLLLKDGAVPGSNTPAPDASGNYTIIVNFLANTYTLALD